jgi:hypothetical protein
MAMEPFTYDVESITLSPDEMCNYAEAILNLCHVEIQHELSDLLANVYGVSDTTQQDRAQLMARKMWRTVVRT